MGEANLFCRILISAEIRPREGDILRSLPTPILPTLFSKRGPDFQRISRTSASPVASATARLHWR